MRYRGYPLSRIQQDVGLSFGEVTFNYTHFHAFRELAPRGHALEVLGSSGFEQTNFDFHVDFARGIDDDSLRLALIFDPQVYDGGLIERLRQYYLRAYELMLERLDEQHQAQFAARRGGTAPAAALFDWCGRGLPARPLRARALLAARRSSLPMQ